MNITTTQHQAWMPLVAALQQIEHVNVSESVGKLIRIKDKLTQLQRVNNVNSKVAVTKSLALSIHEMNEMFAGSCGRYVTPKGVSLLKEIHDNTLLIYKASPGHFPNSLLKYAMNKNTSNTVEPIKKTENKESEINNAEVKATRYSEALPDSSTSKLSYGHLFYLFESSVGSKIGKSQLEIEGTTVTRSTIKWSDQTSKSQGFETVFFWDNESGVTQYRHRSDSSN